MDQPDILYISAMFDYASYEKLFTLKKKPMHAANKFHTLFLQGLAANGVKVTAYSSLPLSRENCEKKYVRIPKMKENGVIHSYIPVFNVPGIRHIQLFIKSFFKAMFSSRKTMIIYDPLVVASSYGAVLGAKCSRKKSIAVVTDLPQFMPIAHNQRMLKMNEKLLSMASGYVFLTRQMNDAVNPKNKPYIVVEGFVDKNMVGVEHKTFDDGKKKIIYAGSLHKKYGIADLCHAFMDCGVVNAELHIYGDGDYAPELCDLVKKNSKIIYHGNCLNAEVVKAELDATLLVNPRPAEGEYTKYSFPSKTLEYMVSGTPVLTAHLAGIPLEYNDYVYFFENDQSSLMFSLKNILSLPQNELAKKGDSAREFVLNHKNNVIQAKKVLDLIRNVK